MRRMAMLWMTGGLMGCHEPTSTGPRLAATYAMETTNGRPLPSVVSEGGGQQYTLIADTLRFELDGQVRRSTVVRWVSTTIAPGDTTYTQRITLPYEIDGRSLIIGFTTPCPANASCIGFDTGSIDDERVSLEGRMFWPGNLNFVFRRVGRPE